jgi:hypothetical protein
MRRKRIVLFPFLLVYTHIKYTGEVKREGNFYTPVCTHKRRVYKVPGFIHARVPHPLTLTWGAHVIKVEHERAYTEGI